MKKYILSLLILIVLLNLFLRGSFVGLKEYDKVTILEQRSLSYNKKDGIPFMGISDLAYDEKNHKLYLLSDRSILYDFSAIFDDKIKELHYNAVYKLRSSSHKYYDSEGLALNHKNQLLLSHERSAGIIQISNEAKVMKCYTLPKKLQQCSSYRDNNKLLESVVEHPKYGLLTAAEYPLRKQKRLAFQTIYSLDGKEWNFKMQNYPNTAITSMEVMDDNNILVLERSYRGYFYPIIVTLKKVYLNECDKENLCKSERLLSFHSYRGDGFNNFEGLTKVAKNRYVMVSDNNGKRLLPTKIIYFQID
jgi:hypothetical protein